MAIIAWIVYPKMSRMIALLEPNKKGCQLCRFMTVGAPVSCCRDIANLKSARNSGIIGAEMVIN